MRRAVRSSMSRFLIADWIRRSVPVAALSPPFIAAISAALMSSRIMRPRLRQAERAVVARRRVLQR